MIDYIYIYVKKCLNSLSSEINSEYNRIIVINSEPCYSTSLTTDRGYYADHNQVVYIHLRASDQQPMTLWTDVKF